ncbi:MAG: hypothetical protein CR993_04315 [Rhodobacterales bacterium]|nr:MAG: hypothetical protein CR993_04315 [Rhodobacterales bacterium]
MIDLATPEGIEAAFTQDGTFRFARWGRPIAPIVFGVEDPTIETLKGAIEAVTGMVGHPVAETDPELGSNLMFFFFRDWDELLAVPDLGRMIPDLAGTVGRLKAAGAQQYRAFRFDEAGAIQASFAFLNMSGPLAELTADTIALGEAVQSMLTFSGAAFREQSPLALHPETGVTILRPEVARLIRAAYDPVLPAAATDPSHALRLFARLH